MRFACLLFAIPCSIQGQEPIRYTVRFPAPQTHYLEVVAQIPAAKAEIELFLPVWTPGSYLVREYARNLEDLQAEDPAGRPLLVEKTRKNRWRIRAQSAPAVAVRYKVYAHEMSVQGNWVDAGFAMLNGAPNFMTLAGDTRRRHEVTLELPVSWRFSISGLRNGPGGPNHWIASDYDELVDSPIYAGSAPVHLFEAGGKPHYLVNEGEGPLWDGPAAAQAVKKIVEEFRRMWGSLPYEKYVFFNMIVESGGGLEHRNSTWMGTTRWAWRNTTEPAIPASSRTATSAGPALRGTRFSWLRLVSHEYFHLWNVKRLRPRELGPFDYENEVYTQSLWIAEGFTSYYGPLGLKRAGLTNRDQFLRGLGQTINTLQTTPGRQTQPVGTSSFDAWIKHYRPNENSPNTAISYYTKGEVIAFLLDAKIRKATAGAKSLDDVMKLALERYGGERGYTPDEFRRTASEVAGAELNGWFAQVAESTEELDYREALEWYGLRFRPAPAAPAKAWLGVTAVNNNGRLLVTQVRRDTPGHAAGLNVDDEILAINQYRVRPDGLAVHLESYAPGEKVSILIARRDRVMRLDVVFGAEPRESWQLEVHPAANDAQKAHLAAWLLEPATPRP